MRRILLISEFAGDESCGHVLLDDEYYFGFLAHADVPCVIYTSPYSAARLAQKFPRNIDHIRHLGDVWPKARSGDRVIFLGYSEASVLRFIMRHIFALPEIILVATNNISRGRVTRHRYLLWAFLSVAALSIHRLVLNSEAEARMVSSLVPHIAPKIAVKRHHLMRPVPHSVTASNDGRPIISYFGPEKLEKPLTPFVALIKADTDARFDYYINRVNADEMRTRFPGISDRSNVNFHEDLQSHDQYLESVARSTFVFMSHNSTFEGKLSGNLCDCVAVQVPFIARPMDPLLAYATNYGELGYFVDFDEEDWAQSFLARYDAARLQTFAANLNRLAGDHSKAELEKDLTSCFLS